MRSLPPVVSGSRPVIGHSREFFARTDDSLSIRDGMAFLSRLFGRDFYFLADTNEYQRQREIVLPRFQSRQLEGYLAWPISDCSPPR